MKLEKYSIEPTEPFEVDQGRNYIIDLPIGEWGKVAVVKSYNHLKNGDMLRLPNGSWLEVTIDKDACFGYDGKLFGLVRLLTQSEKLDEEIRVKIGDGLVYQVGATYIR